MKCRTCLAAAVLGWSILLAGCHTDAVRVTGSGMIEAVEVTISPAVAGEIIEMSVDEGSVVESGALLVRLDMEPVELERAATATGLVELDASELQASAQIAQARTALEGARKTYNRAVDLKAKGAIPVQQYDDAGTAYELAQRQLETARTSLETINAKRSTIQARLNLLDYQISQGLITAPSAGRIIETYVEKGERTGPGKPLLSMAKLDEVWTKIYVGQADLGKVRLGAAARVLVDTFPDRVFNGKVTWISDKSEFTPKNVQTRDARADLVYAVKVAIPNPEGVFKIGMPVDVLLEGFPEYGDSEPPRPA